MHYFKKVALILSLYPIVSFAHTHNDEDANTNPLISVHLNATYNSSTLDPEDYYIPGFQRGEEAELLSPRFSLNEVEFNFEGNIDDLLYGYVAVALEQEDRDIEVELEEAYFRTLALPCGFAIKAGRFYSGIGYLNTIHVHEWDFVDAPLVYRALFNNQYNDDGVQFKLNGEYAKLNWTLGTELFKGVNFPASTEDNDIGAITVFGHFQRPFNDNQAVRLGISYIHAKPNNRIAVLPEVFEDNTFSFTGKSNTAGVDLFYYWKALTIQSEFYNRKETGNILYTAENTSLNSHEKGAYLQALYEFIPNWRLGYRYDWLKSHNTGDNPAVLNNVLLTGNDFHPHQNTLMLDYSPSESVLLRMQYNRDYSQPQLNNQVFLQVITHFGAHAAHA